jgi:hypothetical protein
MNKETTQPEHQDRTLVLAIIGVLLLSIGAVAAFLGPIETIL